MNNPRIDPGRELEAGRALLQVSTSTLHASQERFERLYTNDKEAEHLAATTADLCNQLARLDRDARLFARRYALEVTP